MFVLVYYYYYYYYTGEDYSDTVTSNAAARGTVQNKTKYLSHILRNRIRLEMWANAQRDGRPAEYRWRPLFNAAKFG